MLFHRTEIAQVTFGFVLRTIAQVISVFVS